MCAVSPDRTVVHRGLLVGPRRPRPPRLPLPAAAVSLLCAEAALGALGPRGLRLVPWGVAGLLVGVGVVLLGLWRLPDRRAVTDLLRAPTLLPVAVLLQRGLLLAACVTGASAVVGVALPERSGGEVLLGLGMLAAVVLASLRPLAPRVLRGAAWCGAVAVALVVVVGAVSASGGVDGAGDAPVLRAAVLVAAVGGVLVRPLLPAPWSAPRERRDVLGTVAATGGVVALLAAGSGAAHGAGPSVLVAFAPVGRPGTAALALVLALVLLAAATATLSGLPPLRPWHTGVPAHPDRVSRVLAVAVAGGALLLASGDLLRLLAGVAVAVLAHALLTLLAVRRCWQQTLETQYQPVARRQAIRGRLVTTVAAVVAAVMLATAAVPGWPAALALGAGWVMMWGVSRHDREQRARLALAHAAEDRPLPTVVRAFVVVPALDRPTVRAVAYARALRATSLEALTVPTDDAAAAALREQWSALDLPVPLVELAAPPGRAADAIVAHVDTERDPDGLAVVYLPEPTAPQRWRRALLRRTPHRLRDRLLALPGTVVTTVPWHVEES